MCHRSTGYQDGVVDSWRFYRDPVVRPPKGHMWNYKDSGRDSLPAEEYEPIQFTVRRLIGHTERHRWLLGRGDAHSRADHSTAAG